MALDPTPRENKGKEPCPHGAESHDLATPQPLATLQALVPSSPDRFIKGVHELLAGSQGGAVFGNHFKKKINLKICISLDLQKMF